MFIEPDERIIIMDNGGGGFYPAVPLQLGELRQLADIGIKTIYCQGVLFWDDLQPSEGAPINFSKLDAYLEPIHSAGLKSVVPFLSLVPSWKSDDWYYRRDHNGIPNYANEQALKDYEDLARALIAHYDPEQFQLAYAIPGDGEFPLHYHAYNSQLILPGTAEVIPTFVLTNWVIQIQRILEAQHGELWSAFHHYNHPKWFPELHDEIRKEFPTSTFYSLQYTYFGNLKRRKHLIKSLQWARDTWNIKYFVGSEYCQGLRDHTPIAIEHGIYGFLTSPIYINQPYKRIEKWMLDDLAWALKQLQERA